MTILRRRAALLGAIREFFNQRGVLEVETPLAAFTTSSHADVRPMKTIVQAAAIGHQQFYLQTSPESHMKRLVAAGSGPVFQVCKAFRDGEVSTRHNPEFTILEWYRPGFSMEDLMSETDGLLDYLLGLPNARRVSYAEIFQDCLGIDPHAAHVAELRRLADVHNAGWPAESLVSDKDAWLELLMEKCIQPTLGSDRPCFVFGFPASQACMACVSDDNPKVAERFELYVGGLEIVNGYRELDDSSEQKARFVEEEAKLRELGLEPPPLDNLLLDALSAGFPDTSGAALGVDRLVMIATGASDISEVLAFPISRA